MQSAPIPEEISATRIWLKRGLITVLVLAVIYVIGLGIQKLFSGGAPHKKQMTTVKLIPDTPPPPPPPPPKEPPKEQPKEQPKEMPKAPEPKPAEAPPAETLKMEGPAGDGPSAIQAGTVTNENLAGKLATIGSDGGAKYQWYAGQIKNQIEKAIEANKKLTQGQYKLVVSVWLKPNGEFERLSLDQSDAQPEVEQSLRETLNNLSAMREKPPENMPMPIRLRISAKKVG